MSWCTQRISRKSKHLLETYLMKSIKRRKNQNPKSQQKSLQKKKN